MVACRQLTCPLQSVIMVTVIIFVIVKSSPLPINMVSRSTDARGLRKRDLMSALPETERMEENIFISYKDRHHLVNHTSEAPTRLIITIPHTQSTFQQEIPLEPECVIHHQYAVIVPTMQADDPAILRFQSKNGEIRYYYCQKCSVCPPGVRIIRPCTKRRNTLCSRSECIDPDDLFDPLIGACFPSTSSTSRPPSSNPVIFETVSGGEKLLDDVDPHMRPLHKEFEFIFLCLTFLFVVLLITLAAMALKSLQWKIQAARSRLGQEISCHSTVSAVIDSPTCPCESPRVEMEVGISQDLTVTTPNREQLVKLPRDVESLLRRETNLNSNGCGDGVNGAVSVLRGTSPYWLVMMGHFGPEGGVLSCQDSDVVLEIPPGAIPTSHPHQFIKAKVSLTPSAVAPELLNDPDFLCLTPLVEFESPGLNKFSKDVLIRLPHKARMTYDSGWTFRTHFTDPTSATKAPQVEAFPSKDPLNCDSWYFVDLKNHMSKSGKSSQRRSRSNRGVTCTVDEKYFNISTPHFSKYACSGCHKNHPLHFETVVYAGHLKGSAYEEVKLIIYIIDPIKDHRRLVEQEQREANAPRTRVSEYHPIILDYNKNFKDDHFLEVTLMPDGTVNHWQWKMQYEDLLKAQQLIRYQDLIRCCSNLGPFLHTFNLEPKATCREDPLSVFKAMIYFRQHQKHKSPQRDPVKVVITLPLSDQCFGSQLSNTRNNGSLGCTVITEDHIDVVLTNLLPKDWRRLFRKLMGKNVENEIQCIVARSPTDVHEQKHDALLSWRRSRGRGATVDALISALRSLDLTEIAESLEINNNCYPLRETAI